MLKANSQINEITQREYIKGYKAHLSASQICLPGLVFAEKNFPGFSFGLMNTGTLFLEHWGASAVIESRFSPVVWVPQPVCLVKPSVASTKPCWQCGVFCGCRCVTHWAGELEHRQLGQMNVGGRWLCREVKGRIGCFQELPMRMLLRKAWGKRLELPNGTGMENWEREEKHGWSKDDLEEMGRGVQPWVGWEEKIY